MIDERTERIGAHASVSCLPWAVNALGPVPAGAADLRDWWRRAAAIGAYRELSGYNRPEDPIGPEPVAAVPDMRTAWYAALAALGPVDGPDVRGMPGGTHAAHARHLPVETAWSPQWTGDELRQVRAGAEEARLAAIRADAKQAPAGTACKGQQIAGHLRRISGPDYCCRAALGAG